MRGSPIRYSPAELRFIRRRRQLPRCELLAAFRKRFGRDDVTQVNLNALCHRKGWRGQISRFAEGYAPHNKGKPWKLGIRFQRGNVPHNKKEPGAEYVNKHGYVQINVGHGYTLKHRLLWERLHGLIPVGMTLKCLGGRLDTDPSNWELVPRALLHRLNGRNGRGYDQAPDELKPTIMAIARLEHQVRRARERPWRPHR
jgi:hypothetical protein